MTILIPRSGPPLHLHDHLDRLRRLLADVEALARGEHPSPATLASAPTLEDWTLASRPATCLAGRFFNHPLLGSGRPGITSDLWVLAPSLGYARTLSRTYRLGEPATDVTGTVQ